MRGKEGALGSTLLCYQPKQGVDPDFLFYLLQSFYGFTNTATIGGAVPHLDTRLLDRLWITTPTEEREQQKIGAILSSVDAALTAGQSKLTAARRLKTALMQQLFTRGIPGAHTEFKQTKIGEVPGPWDVVRLQTVLAGPPFNGVSPSSRPNPPGTPILNVECIDDGHCSPCNVSYVDVDEVTAQECRARRGDFYVLRGNGNRDYVATGGYLSEEPEVPTIFSDKLIRLRFDESKLVERFIPYLWQNKTFLHRLQSKAVSGSGLWMMGKRDIRREFIAYPVDKGEQGQIVELIDAAIQSILACEAEVASLERLKRSLLQNLITGRVPVRIEP